jgi:hypothetical protein
MDPDAVNTGQSLKGTSEIELRQLLESDETDLCFRTIYWISRLMAL